MFIALITIAGLAGCSWFNFGRDNNANTQVRETLEVPPDLVRPSGTDLSAPSGARKPATASAQSDQATPSAVAPSAPVSERVRLERDGAQRWLVVQDDPKRVWVEIRDYFLRNKMKLTSDNAATGILETEWLPRPVQADSALGKFFSYFRSTGMRDRYRVRIESGRVAGTSEVYVSHQAQEEVVASGGGVQVVQTVWQPAASDPQIEAEMLAKLMDQLGADPKQAQRLQLASTSERIQSVKDGLLISDENMDSAWRLVGQALDRAAVTIEDRDRTAGIYYVRYKARSGDEKGGSVTGWLLGDSSEGKKDGSRDRFQVALQSSVRGTVVNIRNVAGEPDPGKTAKELLDTLQQQLR